MALKTKAVIVAALLGATAMPVALWAQTTTTPASPATSPDAGTPAPVTAPATDAAATDGAASAPAGTEAAAAPDAAAGTTPDAAAATPAADPATPADAPAADGAPAPSAPAPGAPAMADGADAAQVGGFYIDQTQGDWQLRCQKTEDGKDPCELYQLMRDNQNNPVAEMSIIPLSGKAAAGATMVAPLETDLLPGLGFKVDAGKQMAYPFSFCSPIGCFSRVAFSQAEIDSLKKGTKVTVTLQPYGAPADTRVDLSLSLKGFTAAWDAVRAKMPEAPVAQTDAPAAAPKQ